MSQNPNKRLTNPKTKDESGLDFVMYNMDLNTPFGKKQLKELNPFFPGEEDLLREELEKIESTIAFVKANTHLTNKIQEVFMEIKDCSSTITRSGVDTLSMVELYDMKLLLLQMRQLLKLTKDHEIGDYVGHHAEECVPGKDSGLSIELTDKKETNGSDNTKELPMEYILEDTEDLLNELDPRRDRLGTFYIYEEFSDTLAELRSKKREYELLIRKEQKSEREELRKKYKVNLTPKFDIVVAKSHPDFEMIQGLSELEIVDQDYMSVTLKLKPSDKVYEYVGMTEDINSKIDTEEERIRAILSKKIFMYKDTLLENCRKIGAFDLALAKAIYSIKNNLTKPEITDEHIIEFVDGRNIRVEESLKNKGIEYCPVSLSLKDGVTVITGANMGGKTVSLKLAAQIPILAQYGFFVPATSATVGLSNYMQMLIGDSQSLERGLSSFGSEMEELKEILNRCEDRSLIFIDEIASGTNPTEGTALTKSLIDYLNKKPYISLITTHFETVTRVDGVVNMQVRGLAGCDFDKLYKRIQNANRRERIAALSKFMDYSLCRVENESQVPKDALNIAAILGIDKAIIEGAKKYI